jgi:hypothetical protein
MHSFLFSRVEGGVNLRTERPVPSTAFAVIQKIQLGVGSLKQFPQPLDFVRSVARYVVPWLFAVPQKSSKVAQPPNYWFNLARGGFFSHDQNLFVSRRSRAADLQAVQRHCLPFARLGGNASGGWKLAQL